MATSVDDLYALVNRLLPPLAVALLAMRAMEAGEPLSVPGR